VDHDRLTGITTDLHSTDPYILSHLKCFDVVYYLVIIKIKKSGIINLFCSLAY